MKQSIRKLMTCLMLLICSMGAWADDNVVTDPILQLKHAFGDKATVTFYTYIDSDNEGAPTKENISSFINSSPVTALDEFPKYVVAHIVPAAGYWTDAALLYAWEPLKESITVPGGQTRGTGVDPVSEVKLIQLDEGRYDGAGWYYYKFNEEHSTAEYSGVSILDGAVLPKFDLSKGTASTDGKTYTFTVETEWTTTITIDDGGTSFTYNGSAQGPTKFTNTNIVVKKGDAEYVTFNTVADHLKTAVLSAKSGSVLTQGSAVDAGSYALTIEATEAVTTASANTRATTGTADAPTTGIFTNQLGIDFTINNASFADGDITAKDYSGVYDGQGHTISVTTSKSATVKYGKTAGTYDLTQAPKYTDVGNNTVYYQVTMANYNPVAGSKTVVITQKVLTATVTAANKEYDGTTKATITPSITTGIDGEALKITGMIGVFADKNVGTGKTVTLDGGVVAADNDKTKPGNYNVAIPKSTTANITAKALTITADEKTKVEGEEDPALTYKSEGLVSGDAITGALTRATGETAGTYAITQGTLSAGTNYTVTYKGANLTITAAPKPVTPEDPTYQVIVAKATGGNVVTSVTEAKKGQQVNMIVTPAKGYYLSSLSVVPAVGGSIQPGVTFDKDKNMFNFFIMPASDVTIYATFDAQEKDQNIFIFKSEYGEIVANVLHAEPGQQVNLETRIKDGFDNVVLDELYVYNEKGERLPVSTIEDPKEGLVYYFFMKGDKAYVYNTFKGTNGTVDESKPVPPDNYLYLLSDAFNNFINAGNGVSGVQMAMSLLANILATFTPEGELSVNMGDDVSMALLNLKLGWQIKIDFNGAPIKVLYPSLLEGLGEDGTISSGVFYKMLSDGNLELLLKTGMLPLLIQSITIIAPEPDPTAINGLKADGAASEIYDLRGRKVDATNLRKGIYIRDGRKVVIK